MSAADHVGRASRSRTEELRASPKMFSWRWLDKLSRARWYVPILVFLPVISALTYWALQEMSALGVLVLAAAGWIFWTLFEYWLHRVVFHFEPERGILAKLHWIIHGVHHEHPNDPLRLVMPAGASLPLGGIVFAVLWLVFGNRHAPGIGAGFFTGYLVYDLLHYYLHHGEPRSKIGKRFRSLHYRHHFQDGTKGFGISSPFWDKVFRTSFR